ncbi:hypothetical protein PFISCL1PPCAC_18151, partial [Pristionchus fissidentatus]
ATTDSVSSVSPFSTVVPAHGTHASPGSGSLVDGGADQILQIVREGGEESGELCHLARFCQILVVNDGVHLSECIGKSGDGSCNIGTMCGLLVRLLRVEGSHLRGHSVGRRPAIYRCRYLRLRLILHLEDIFESHAPCLRDVSEGRKKTFVSFEFFAAGSSSMSECNCNGEDCERNQKWESIRC